MVGGGLDYRFNGRATTRLQCRTGCAECDHTGALSASHATIPCLWAFPLTAGQSAALPSAQPGGFPALHV